jgi:hypothetical protein|tara:strand:+ start:31 stop:678 length:648 start_codon:yes stop_codon:yes gene_type:complete
MGYFRELPNLRYPSFLPNKSSSLDFVEVKNLFRRAKMRDDLQNNFTIFNKYEIPMGARPDTVAEDLYGSAQFDWVILTVAGIINVRNEWPLNPRDLYDYSLDKYGDALNSTRYFETTEVKDSNGRLVLPKGKVVDSNFTIPKPGTPNATLNPVVGVSNYDYETIQNDKKSRIFVLREEYLQEFLNDMREIMVYDESSEYLNDRTIQTENTNITLP